MINKKEGFTLIELLVVIAIIGILSSVVLASLNTARGKGANSAIKEDLDNMRAQAELSYDNNGQSYSIVCADPNIVKALANAASAAGATVAATNAVGSASLVTCDNAVNTWTITSPLKATEVVGGTTYGYWCVDNIGNSKDEVTFAAAGATQCP